MILVPRPLASYKSVSYSKFSLGIHYADSSSMGVVSSPPPAETSADVASPCFSKGTVGSTGGPGRTAIFGPGGLIILPWTVQGDHFRGGTVHGMTVLSICCC